MVNWWTFAGVVPLLVYIVIGLIAANMVITLIGIVFRKP